MAVKDLIESKLRDAISPQDMEIVDESASHAGHLEAASGGGTHFRVRVTAGAFAGKSRLERHRLIHHILADELAHGVHALAIEAKAPGEPT